MGFTMPCKWKVEGVKPHENWDYSHTRATSQRFVHPQMSDVEEKPRIGRRLGMIPRKLSFNEVRKNPIAT